MTYRTLKSCVGIAPVSWLSKRILFNKFKMNNRNNLLMRNKMKYFTLRIIVLDIQIRLELSHSVD